MLLRPWGLVAAASAVAGARVAISATVPVDPATLGLERPPMGGRLLFRPPVLADASPDDANGKCNRHPQNASQGKQTVHVDRSPALVAANCWNAIVRSLPPHTCVSCIRDRKKSAKGNRRVQRGQKSYPAKVAGTYGRGVPACAGEDCRGAAGAGQPDGRCCAEAFVEAGRYADVGARGPVDRERGGRSHLAVPHRRTTV